MIQIRIAEKKKVLMLASQHEAFVEELVGLFLSRACQASRPGAAAVIWPRAVRSTKLCTIFELKYPKPRAGWPSNAASRTSQHSHATARSAFRGQTGKLMLVLEVYRF